MSRGQVNALKPMLSGRNLDFLLRYHPLRSPFDNNVMFHRRCRVENVKTHHITLSRSKLVGISAKISLSSSQGERGILGMEVCPHDVPHEPADANYDDEHPYHGS